MNNKRSLIALFIAFSFVVVLSNMITAKYIENKVNNKIRAEIESLSYQIMQVRHSTDAVYSSTKPEERWNDVMAPTELAKYLDIKLAQVYNIIDDKESEIPYVLIEGAYRFNKDAIDKWLTSRKVIVGESIVY